MKLFKLEGEWKKESHALLFVCLLVYVWVVVVVCGCPVMLPISEPNSVEYCECGMRYRQTKFNIGQPSSCSSFHVHLFYLNANCFVSHRRGIFSAQSFHFFFFLFAPFPFRFWWDYIFGGTGWLFSCTEKQIMKICLKVLSCIRLL